MIEDDDRRHLAHSFKYCNYICRPSPTWQMVKAVVLLRSHGECEVCWGSGAAATQVHHISYDRLGFEDIATDLLAVCRQCHIGLTHHRDEPMNGRSDGMSWDQAEQIAILLVRLVSSRQFEKLSELFVGLA